MEARYNNGFNGMDYSGLLSRRQSEQSFTPIRFLDVNLYYGLYHDDIQVVNRDTNTVQMAYLFGTPIGDRPFHPNYGCRLLEYLFDPVMPELEDIILTEAVQAVKKWLEHIKLIEQFCKCTAIPEEQLYHLDLPYKDNIGNIDSGLARLSLKGDRTRKLGNQASNSGNPPKQLGSKRACSCC